MNIYNPLNIQNLEKYSLPLRLFPDYEKPQSVFFVCPAHVPKRMHLSDFYLSLPSYIPADIKISFLFSDERVEQLWESVLSLRYPAHVFENHIIESNSLCALNDIWIRDWAPVPAVDNRGNRILVKPVYRPQYLDEIEASSCNMAGMELAHRLCLPVMELPLVWDIGNLTHNGSIAITTKRLLKDNGIMSEKQIKEVFRFILGIRKLIIVDEEVGDVTGHIDGTVRFLGEHTLAISKYPEDCIEENRCIERIKKQIVKDSSNDLEVIEIPNALLYDEPAEGIYSAFGNHMNFLLMGNNLLFPQYRIASDTRAHSIITKACPAYKIIDVNSSLVSSQGGVLNCISWCLY